MKCLGRLLRRLLPQSFLPQHLRKPVERSILGKTSDLWTDSLLRETAKVVEHPMNPFAPGVAGGGMKINIKRPTMYTKNCEDNRTPLPQEACIQGAQQGLGATTGSSTIGFKNPAQTPSISVSVNVEATHSFSAALRHAVNGGRIARVGWNGKGQHVTSQHPDKFSKMGAPYLVLKNMDNVLVPWVPSQGDLFAMDWALIPDDSNILKY